MSKATEDSSVWMEWSSRSFRSSFKEFSLSLHTQMLQAFCLLPPNRSPLTLRLTPWQMWRALPLSSIMQGKTKFYGLKASQKDANRGGSNRCRFAVCCTKLKWRHVCSSFSSTSANSLSVSMEGCSLLNTASLTPEGITTTKSLLIRPRQNHTSLPPLPTYLVEE